MSAKYLTTRQVITLQRLVSSNWNNFYIYILPLLTATNKYFNVLNWIQQKRDTPRNLERRAKYEIIITCFIQAFHQTRGNLQFVYLFFYQTQLSAHKWWFQETWSHIFTSPLSNYLLTNVFIHKNLWLFMFSAYLISLLSFVHHWRSLLVKILIFFIWDIPYNS